MQKADRFTIDSIGIPSMVLMERAALQVVNILEAQQLEIQNTLVVCGSGNNGGDGYAIARLLHLKGFPVTILFVGKEEKRSPENRRQAEIAAHYAIPVINKLEKQEYSVIVDAMFGTGLKREIGGEYYTVLDRLNQMPGVKVAVDMPSGIHDATGTVMGIAFRADITVALAFEKRGLAFYPGCEYAGKVVVMDIGITEEALPKEPYRTVTYDRKDLLEFFPKRKKNSHKGSYGKVLMIVGSKGMSGAAYLSAKAAYTVGAGLVQIYTHEENRIILQQLLPEAIITTYETFERAELERLLEWADVVGIGCGLGTNETAEQLVKHTLQMCETPCVVDADGLNLLSEHMEWLKDSSNLVLTPHMKEMGRLLGCSVAELAARRMEFLTAFVEQYQVTCVMKDARTLVGKRGEDVYVNLSGNHAMAKGGSGDVLSGVISGILAQQCENYEAACLGTYLHGLAGDAAREEKGSYSVLASDIIDGISYVLKEL